MCGAQSWATGRRTCIQHWLLFVGEIITSEKQGSIHAFKLPWFLLLMYVPCTLFFYYFFPTRRLAWNGAEILFWSLFAFRNGRVLAWLTHSRTSNIIIIVIVCTHTHMVQICLWICLKIYVMKDFIMWKLLGGRVLWLSNWEWNQRSVLWVQTRGTVLIQTHNSAALT